jgi:hypothetical protein
MAVDYSDMKFADWSMKFQRAVTVHNAVKGGRGVPLIDWAAASSYYRSKTPIKTAAAEYWEKHIK